MHSVGYHWFRGHGATMCFSPSPGSSRRVRAGARTTPYVGKMQPAPDSGTKP